MNDDQAAIIFGGQTLGRVGQVFMVLAAELKVKELRYAHTELSKIIKLMNDSITALGVEEILKHAR